MSDREKSERKKRNEKVIKAETSYTQYNSSNGKKEERDRRKTAKGDIHTHTGKNPRQPTKQNPFPKPRNR